MPRLFLLACVVAMLGGSCSSGQVTDRSAFEAAVLMPDQRTVVFAYRVLRYRPAQGIAAFPDGGIPTYLDDRVLIASCDVGGGRVRILERLDNPWVHSSDGVGLRVEPADPGRVLATWAGQATTSEPSRTRRWRLDPASSAVLPYPDLGVELARSGRTLGCPAFGDLRVIDPDGTLLLGFEGPDGPGLMVRSPAGDLRRLDAIEQFYGVHGTEVYYWSTSGEAIVRDWRTGAARVIARYDPAIRQTTTLVRNDPTVTAIDRGHGDPANGVGLSDDRSGLTFGTRSIDGVWTYRPIPLDADALRR
jgi:hypothetical protein